jgi:hypothetical protein
VIVEFAASLFEVAVEKNDGFDRLTASAVEIAKFYYCCCF